MPPKRALCVINPPLKMVDSRFISRREGLQYGSRCFPADDCCICCVRTVSASELGRQEVSELIRAILDAKFGLDSLSIVVSSVGLGDEGTFSEESFLIDGPVSSSDNKHVELLSISFDRLLRTFFELKSPGVL